MFAPPQNGSRPVSPLLATCLDDNQSEVPRPPPTRARSSAITPATMPSMRSVRFLRSLKAVVRVRADRDARCQPAENGIAAVSRRMTTGYNPPTGQAADHGRTSPVGAPLTIRRGGGRRPGS